MPIYEYRCTSCQAELEKLQKISEPPLVECPECGKDTLIKLISASSFRLKGSGWYETDFKTGNKKNGAAEETTGTTAESGSTSADAGNKAATKDAAGKSAAESSSKNEGSGNKESGSSSSGSTSSKAETKATAKPATENGGSKTKSS